MVLHERGRYPLLKFLVDEFTGSFFENELTWLNRLVILYHNRRTSSIRDDDDTFLIEFISKDDNLCFLEVLWPKAVQESVRMTKRRVDYLLANNPSLVENLLRREDYGLPRARFETIVQIYEWLGSMNDIDSGTGVNVDEWKQDIQSRFGYKFKILGLAPSKGALRSCIEDVGQFSDIFKGADDKESEAKFEKLLVLLREANWIAPADEPGRFQFRKAAHGGRLWIAALYYAMYQKQHIKESQTASIIAGLFNTWLIHPFSKESFEKVFQPEEQAKFGGKSNHQRARYAQECFLLIQNL